MKKSELEVGQAYATKYATRPHVLLSIGGYLSRSQWSMTAEEKTAGIFVKPISDSKDHLILDVSTGLDPYSFNYTEADYLEGKPLPEGTTLISKSSRELEMTWEQAVVIATAKAKRVAAEKSAKQHRVNVTLPKAQSEIERLGLRIHTSDYTTRIEFTLEQFLELAARIPAGE